MRANVYSLDELIHLGQMIKLYQHRKYPGGAPDQTLTYESAKRFAEIVHLKLKGAMK